MNFEMENLDLECWSDEKVIPEGFGWEGRKGAGIRCDEMSVSLRQHKREPVHFDRSVQLW